MHSPVPSSCPFTSRIGNDSLTFSTASNFTRMGSGGVSEVVMNGRYGVSKVGAAKVMTKTGPTWCHLSKLANTTILRRYSEGTAFQVEADDADIVEFVPLKDCKKLVPAENHGVKNASVWTEILQKLEAKTAPQPVAVKAPLIVPITQLRRVYDVMKILDTATMRNLAAFYRDTPDSLESLWNRSRNVFSEYKNSDNWGRGATEDLPDAPTRLSAVSTTNEFTAYLMANGLGGYTFVEREINPWRTRLGVFSNKLPATKSGRGGMDLLLRSCDTGFPVVGEVKVKRDKNAIFALIQAMTYAVEMSTLTQFKRLKTHFPRAFDNLDPNTAKVEVALIFVNPVDDDTSDSVATLLRNVNERGQCKGLSRTIMLRYEGDHWTTHY